MTPAQKVHLARINAQSEIFKRNASHAKTEIAEIQTDLEAAAIQTFRSKLPERICKLFDKHNLTAAAAKGSLTVGDIDKALAATTFAPYQKMAIKIDIARYAKEAAR